MNRLTVTLSSQVTDDLAYPGQDSLLRLTALNLKYSQCSGVHDPDMGVGRYLYSEATKNIQL
jgi:hypothetical protein